MKRIIGFLLAALAVIIVGNIVKLGFTAQAASPAPWFTVADPAMASHLDNRVVLEWKGKVKAGNSGEMDVAIFRDTQTDARFYVTWWPNVPESTSVTAYPVLPGKTQEVKVER